jgi:hypothetical protein
VSQSSHRMRLDRRTVCLLRAVLQAQPMPALQQGFVSQAALARCAACMLCMPRGLSARMQHESEHSAQPVRLVGPQFLLAHSNCRLDPSMAPVPALPTSAVAHPRLSAGALPAAASFASAGCMSRHAGPGSGAVNWSRHSSWAAHSCCATDRVIAGVARSPAVAPAASAARPRAVHTAFMPVPGANAARFAFQHSPRHDASLAEAAASFA